MKKLLTILATIGLTSTTGTAVVACATNNHDKDPIKKLTFTHKEIENITSPWGFVFLSEIMRKQIEDKYSVKAEIKDENLGTYKFILTKNLTIKIGEDEFSQKEGTELDLSAGFLNKEVEDPKWEDFDKDVESIKNEKNEKSYDLKIKIYSINDEKKGKKIVDFVQKETTLTMKFTVEKAKERTDIELSKTEVLVKEKELDIVTIKNFDKLKGIKVEIKDETIASVTQEEDLITITGVKAGNTTITVSAKDVEKVTISVKVSKEVDPPIPVVKAHLESDTIENFGTKAETQLIIETTGALARIESGQDLVEFDHNLGIKAREKTGTVLFLVTAEGFEDAHLKLEIVKATAQNVILETNLDELPNPENKTIIDKVKELNPLVKEIDLEVVREPVKDEQTYTATIKSREFEGTVDVYFTLVKEDIIVDIPVESPIFLRVNEEAPRVHITNYEKLENIQIVSENEKIGSVSFEDNYGDIHISARGVGETWVNISADNANATIKLHIIVGPENAENLKDILGTGYLGVLNNGEDATLTKTIHNQYEKLKDAKITFVENNNQDTAMIYTDQTFGIAEVTYFIKANISNLGDKIDAKVNMTAANIGSMILNTLHENISEEITFDDYETSEIAPIVKAGDKITVYAKENSQIIQGSFEFTVSKYDINEYTLVLPKEMFTPENTKDISHEVSKYLFNEIGIQVALGYDYELVNWGKDENGEINSVEVKSSTSSNYITGTMVVNTWNGDDIGDLPSWGLDQYTNGKSIWVFNSGVKTVNDENLIIESVNLTDSEWSKIIWTGFLDAQPNQEAWEYFDSKNLSQFLHFTGNPNEVLTNALKGKHFISMGIGGIKLDKEMLNELGVTLNVDVISYTNKEDLTEYGLKAGSMLFEDLTIRLDLEKSCPSFT